MTELNAINMCRQLRSTALIEGRELRVHSVFASTINIIGEDLFFSVVSDNHCLYPMSLRVASLAPFTEYGLRAGMNVLVSKSRIVFTNTLLEVPLHNCGECELSIRSIDLDTPNVPEYKIELLKELISEKGCRDDLSTLVTGKYSNPYAEAVAKRLPDLNKALRDGDVRAAEFAGKLAGGGIGLTPSSDDLLVGYISVYLAASKAKDNNRFVKALKLTQAMSEYAAIHTNVISGAFLKQCGKGLLSEDMMKLILALYTDSGAEIVRSCGQRMLKLGSTSGTDMLTGVVLAVVNLNME